MDNKLEKQFHLTSVFKDALPNSSWTSSEIKVVMSLFAYLDEYKIYLPSFNSQEEINVLIKKIPLEYSMSKNEFIKITNIDASNFSREIKAIRIGLAKKLFNTPHPTDPHKDSGESITWFSKISYTAKESNLVFKINSDALENLVSFVKYSKIKYEYIKPLKSNYTIYTYLFLKIIKDISRNKDKTKETLLTKDLKEKLGLADKYKNINMFREKVLDVVKYEINEFTDLTFDYELEKEGRTFKYIHLYFDYKKQHVIESPKKCMVDDLTDPFCFTTNASEDDYDETSVFEETMFSWGIRAKKIAEIENTYSLSSIQAAIDETEKAEIDGRIKKTQASFFMGTLENKQKNDDEIFEREMTAAQNKQDSVLKAVESEKKESQYKVIESDISLHEDDLSRYLSSKGMGATIDISPELSEFLERLSNVDQDLFKGYKPNFAVLDKGYFDYKTQKQIRPNMYDFLKSVIDQNSV